MRVGHDPLLSLNVNLDALAQSGAGNRAQELYRRISALYQEGYYAVPPDVVSFNSVLKAWRDDPRRALEFWEEEMALPPPPADDDNDPQQIGKKSTESVQHTTTTTPLEPNIRSYNTFLGSLARAGLWEQSELLLRSLQEARSLVVPDRVTYNTVLLSYCRAVAFMLSSSSSSDSSDIDDEEANILRQKLPDRAMRLLDEMIESDHLEPDATTYNTVLCTLAEARTLTCARSAQDLLYRMKQQRPTSTLSSVKPDEYSYTAVIRAWANCRRVDGEENDHPDLLGGISTATSADRALALLEEMRNDSVLPTRVTYTVVMQALCRDNRPQDATSLLYQMLQDSTSSSSPSSISDDEAEKTGGTALATAVVRPDAVMFSALMDGWAQWLKNSSRLAPNNKSNINRRRQAGSEAVRAVLDLLSLMKTWGRHDPDLSPNERTYTSVLATLARSRQASSGPRAEQILDEMNERGIVPTVVHWNAVLDAHAKSPRPDRLRQTRRVWHEMTAVTVGVAPDIISYNTMLSAAASASFRRKIPHSGDNQELSLRRRECLQTGLSIFASLQRDPNVLATSLTYHYLFRVLHNCCVEGKKQMDGAPPQLRVRLVRKAIRLCCQQGCLNDRILEQLARDHHGPNAEFLLHSHDEEDDEEDTSRMVRAIFQLEDEAASPFSPSFSGRTVATKVSDLPPEWSARSLPVRHGR